MKTLAALLVTFLLGCNGAGAAAPALSTDGGTECKLNPDGTQTCGYNCKLGSGRWYCATTPDGQCALQASGSWTCP
jgi:hypothetical protein